MKALPLVQVVLLSLWMGAELLFVTGVAPVAFTVLPTRHLAGLVVAGSLHVLHWVGLTAGVSWLALQMSRQRDQRSWRSLAVIAMVTLTALLCLVLVPRMERDRLAAGGAIGGNLSSSAAESAAATEFTRLHPWSERGEGLVIMIGLCVLSSSVFNSRQDELTVRSGRP